VQVLFTDITTVFTKLAEFVDNLGNAGAAHPVLDSSPELRADFERDLPFLQFMAEVESESARTRNMLSSGGDASGLR